MTNYTVRVELHSSIYALDFEKLHSEMFVRGFSKLIRSDGGKTYHLPKGEYDISTPNERSQVLELAKNAVKATGRTAEILVTESNGRTWDGLPEKK